MKNNNKSFSWPTQFATSTVEVRVGSLILLLLTLGLVVGLAAAYIYYGMTHTPADLSTSDQSVVDDTDEIMFNTLVISDDPTLEEKYQRLAELVAQTDMAVMPTEEQRYETINRLIEQEQVVIN